MDPTNTVLDLLLLVVVAVIGWRLWRTLGTRTGFEQTRNSVIPPESPKPATPQPAKLEVENLPPVWQNHAKEGSTLAKTLVAMAEIDPGLDLNRFLDGAKIVHEKVLEAFSAGLLTEIRQLVSPQVFDTLQSAVSARQKKAEKLNYQLIGYDSLRIVAATLAGETANFKTRFETRLISWTTDNKGNIVLGSSQKVESHVDYWTFERNLKSLDPNWLLVETDAAEDEA
jgi:predicted lipid-binding transport protein (Tim44 family)